MPFTHETTALAPMRSIVRLAVIVVTLALFMGSSFHAMTGQRDLAIIFALATPLGISAWGFGPPGDGGRPRRRLAVGAAGKGEGAE